MEPPFVAPGGNVITLRPPDHDRLFAPSAAGTVPLAPPPPPSAGSLLRSLGVEREVGAPPLPSLSPYGARQLYDEAAFAADAPAADCNPTPKSELRRLAAELRIHVRLAALALADESQGLDAGDEAAAKALRS